MNNRTLKFKTNLKCGNCFAKVKPQLDEVKEIVEWSVDLKDPERILTVEIEEAGDGGIVEKILADAGYKATPCSE